MEEKGAKGIKRFKVLLHGLLHPYAAVYLLSAFFGFSGLVAVFWFGLGKTAFVYAVYTVSFYALVVTCRTLIDGLRRFARWLNRFRLVQRYRTDRFFHVRVGQMLSLTVNVAFAVFRIVSAFVYTSFWHGALGAYYLLLCAIRLYLIFQTSAQGAVSDFSAQALACRRAGRMLLALDLLLAWVTYQIVREGQGYRYPGTLIYAVGAYAFYAIIMAAVQAVKYRRYKSPVLSAAKSVNLTTALVSLFSLEDAMMYSFGGDEAFWGLMLPITAGIMWVLNVLISVSMLRTPVKPNADQEDTL